MGQLQLIQNLLPGQQVCAERKALGAEQRVQLPDQPVVFPDLPPVDGQSNGCKQQVGGKQHQEDDIFCL